MIRVESRPGEPLEKTLKRFKKQCEKEGLSKDINKCAYYEKPSERRRRRSRQEAKRGTKPERPIGPRAGRFGRPSKPGAKPSGGGGRFGRPSGNSGGPRS